MALEIHVARSSTPELVDAFNQLLPQLSTSAEKLTAETLDEVLSWNGNDVLVARLDGTVVGTLSLVTFPIPTGVRCRIEDVVVDEAARGHGVGDALVQCALRKARRRGACSVDLTSRPSREAANRLYQRLGFEQRQSLLYRWAGDTNR